MSRGKRYETEGKLNYQKVFAVIIAVIVIIMVVMIIVPVTKIKRHRMIQVIKHSIQKNYVKKQKIVI